MYFVTTQLAVDDLIPIPLSASGCENDQCEKKIEGEQVYNTENDVLVVCDGNCQVGSCFFCDGKCDGRG